MKRLLQKLESLTKISFLQIKDARSIYGQLSTVEDSSESMDVSDSMDYSVMQDYSISQDKK